MASAVNVGSINMPKMMRHLSHRSSQIRDLTFVRDAIKQKDVKTTGANTDTEGSGSTLSGPAVSFGYEKVSYATAAAGTDTAYHVSSPQILISGLTMLQSPIVSRRGRLEKTGHRISGACTFYAPSLDYIKALDNFKDDKAFIELETYDKLYDIERKIISPTEANIETISDATVMGDEDNWSGSIYTKVMSSSANHTITFVDATAGFEIDRLQFKIRRPSGSGSLDNVILTGYDDSTDEVGTLTWETSLTLSSTEWYTVDIPIRNPEDDLEPTIGGTKQTFSLTNDNFNMNRFHGANHDDSELRTLAFDVSGSSSTVEIKDIYFYKEAEWRIEGIKDYRDEYMQISAARVRGDRTSRRRTYG